MACGAASITEVSSSSERNGDCRMAATLASVARRAPSESNHFSMSLSSYTRVPFFRRESVTMAIASFSKSCRPARARYSASSAEFVDANAITFCMCETNVSASCATPAEISCSKILTCMAATAASGFSFAMTSCTKARPRALNASAGMSASKMAFPFATQEPVDICTGENIVLNANTRTGSVIPRVCRCSNLLSRSTPCFISRPCACSIRRDTLASASRFTCDGSCIWR
mmetsp:Transcript_6148/g.16375  ORF Transcript_6148/g.16375 Transcript_6148/m.16375 type:complete len:229 (+) Transcript_6148:277-963(+)